MPRQISDPEDPRRFRLIRGVIIAVALSALGLALLGSPYLSRFFLPTDLAPSLSAAASNTATAFQPSITPSQGASATPLPTHTPAPINSGGSTSLGGLMIMSLSEFGYAQLFNYQFPEAIRITSGAWDDIHPALSPDGTRVAFASNRGGHWDLFILDLQSGETSQLSNDAAYDGHPSWSSDGLWLAYEHYQDENLEIYFRPVDNSIDSVPVSANTGVDHSPAWRPGTQQIAYVSDRGGNAEIWLVDLEQSDDARFRLLVPADAGTLSSPAWSPDGSQLAWSANDGFVPQIFTRRASDLESTRPLGAGLEPRWSPAGDALLATFRSANATYLTAYTLDGGLALAPTQLAGRFEGAAWGSGALPDALPGAIAVAAANDPNPGWAAALDAAVQAGSSRTAELEDVNAPVAQLNAAIIAPFDALRQRSAQLLGWDALSNLEEAFVPLNEPLPPGRQQSWLYTGRAFALHSGLLDEGWLAVVPEEFAGQTYWRVYLRSAAIDGLGRPLTERPWDFAARLSGDAASVQAGGTPAIAISAGTWVDFTALASDYGFERLPAMPNWHSYYPGALFNEFTFTAGLSWQQAMLQLYSESAVATAAASGAE